MALRGREVSVSTKVTGDDSEDTAMRLELPMDPTTYCPDWGWWECIRELVQNQLDAARRGAAARTEVGVDGEVLTVRLYNDGARMPRRALVLGGTDKRGDDAQNQVGYHGDGLKSSAARILQMGGTIQIRTGHERWTFAQAKSATYESTILAVDLESDLQDAGCVIVTVTGVPREEWDRAQTRFVPAPKDPTFLRTPEGRPPCLFVGGIYVGEAVDWSLGDVSLPIKGIRQDRDRNAVVRLSSWDAVRAMTRAVDTGVFTPDELVRWVVTGNMKATDEKCRSFIGCTTPGNRKYLDLDAVNGALIPGAAEAWTRIMGDVGLLTNALAMRDCEHYGVPFVMSPFPVSWAPKAEAELRRRQASLFTAGGALQDAELDHGHSDALQRVRELLGHLDPSHPAHAAVMLGKAGAPLVCAARLTNARGCYVHDTEVVMIDLGTLDCGSSLTKGQLLVTVAHECAHWSTGAKDLTPEHTNAMQDWSAVLYSLVIQHGL